MIVTPEDKLYAVPGIEKFNARGYGLVDLNQIHSEMPLAKEPQVKGYMVALWADAADHRTDSYLLSRAYKPMAVMAERTWSGRSSSSLDAFYVRLRRVAQVPRLDLAVS